jgi:osmotically-inducible protein OsmY
MKNDRQLQHDVVERLERELHLGDDAIGVEVHHGVVKLAGWVGDHSTMKHAELAARQVEGVITVVMDLNVLGSGTLSQPSQSEPLRAPMLRRAQR